MDRTLTKLQDTFTSNLPIATFAEKFFYEDNNDNNDDNKKIIYSILLGIVQLVICIYTLYTIWKCLKETNDNGDYKNGICEFVIAGCCLPCYLFWRTFISPCGAPKVNTQPPAVPVNTSLQS